jgi:Secretion system C-terminal sorting domain
MKAFPIIILFLLTLPVNLFSQNNQHPLTYSDFDTVDVNNVRLVTSNVGNCNGARWLSLQPTGYGNRIIFDHGPWIVGKVNNEPILSIIEWWRVWNYSPGPIINGEAAMLIHPEDSLKYRTYKITEGDDETNPDYAEWPVEFGAPVDANGEPLIKGNQTLWSVYNSLDSTATLFGGTWNGPLTNYPLEINQTVFARNGFENDSENIFANVVFMEWEIINKGSSVIDSTFFGFWSDIDFGSDYNRPGIDTLRQLAYCWDEYETIYDSIPPAFGYVLLYGPAVPSAGNTATFRGRQLINHENLKINAFRGIADDSIYDDSLHAPVLSMLEAQNVARGLTSNGYPIINPITNEPTTFPFSGDPVTGEGWVYNYSTSFGAGLAFFSGPFSLAPNDTQWVMIALVPGIGESNLDGITQVRRKAEILRSLPYDSLAFGSLNYPVTDVENEETPILLNFKLGQNYPNPFNPTTVISYQIPQSGFVTVKIFDVLGRKVATLISEEKPAGSYEVNFSAKGLASGVYIYRLKVNDFIESKKMLLIK